MHPNTKAILLHAALFLLTSISVCLAGVQWQNRDPFELDNLWVGTTYAFLILLFLLSHEFGHYIAARVHGVDASLPYFLPFPGFLGLAPFGTLGAVIRIKSAVPSKKALFDIGIAGPLAGAVVSIITLIVGFRTLPSVEYLYTIHPEYSKLAALPETGLAFGGSILYNGLAHILPEAGAFVPPMNEMYHYPYLCVGWFGLFVTSLNLLPIGQLDGGHISAALFGRFHNPISQAALILLVILGTLGILPAIGYPFAWGWLGWLLWALLLAISLRSLRSHSHEFEEEESLDSKRRALGWICVILFLSTFTLVPFSV